MICFFKLILSLIPLTIHLQMHQNIIYAWYLFIFFPPNPTFAIIYNSRPYSGKILSKSNLNPKQIQYPGIAFPTQGRLGSLKPYPPTAFRLIFYIQNFTGFNIGNFLAVPGKTMQGLWTFYSEGYPHARLGSCFIRSKLWRKVFAFKDFSLVPRPTWNLRNGISYSAPDQTETFFGCKMVVRMACCCFCQVSEY